MNVLFMIISKCQQIISKSHSSVYWMTCTHKFERENYLRAGGVILVPLRLSERRVSASAAWARWLIAISKSSAVKSWFAMSSSWSVRLHFWVTKWIPALGADSPTLLLKYCPQNRHSRSAKSHTEQLALINKRVFHAYSDNLYYKHS